jgi:S-adenosylmethionine-dependent methyltransferase
MTGDRNFDDLAHRFEHNVYDTTKGQIRLSVIERDLREHLPALYQPYNLRILDAGSGTAPISVPLLQGPQELTLVDVSVEMLKRALSQAQSEGKKPMWHQCSIEEFTSEHWDGKPYDIIFCHAVIEWVNQPQLLLQHLSQLLAWGGWLSLSFYNRDGLIFKNLLRTNFSGLKNKQISGSKRSLTPSFPRTVAEVKHWCHEVGFDLKCHSGIRVFHDYVLNKDDREREPEQLMALELEYSRQDPYRGVGRYQHFLLKKH